MTPLPARIGRYEVLSLLGQGGMGVLYLARDPVIDRHVALKLLKVDDDDLRRRFVREARSAGRLQHPNIVTVYDVGDHDGELFIAMEYIDGDTLATLIRDDVPFSTLRKLEMLDQLADGLAFAHSRSIIHRDIKPANLMVTRGGLLKVLDFGIARIARGEMADASMAGTSLIGTPAYMAPEQLTGETIDHRADIFAVGLVMYELLSGRRAFTGSTTAELLESVTRAEPVPLNVLVPHIDLDLVQCVNRALAKRPDDRYQGLQDLRSDIGRVRRRAEYESGSFDATIVVPIPPQPRAVPSPPAAPPVRTPAAAPAATGSAAGARPAPPGPPQPRSVPSPPAAPPVRTPAAAPTATGSAAGARPAGVPPPLETPAPLEAPAPPGSVAFTGAGSSDAPTEPGRGAGSADTDPADGDEGEVLRHLASGPGRSARAVVVPPPRPLPSEPPDVPGRVYDADAPTVVVPVFAAHQAASPAPMARTRPDATAPPPVYEVPPPEPVAQADPPASTFPTPARRSMLPALIVLAIVVVMLVGATLGALWWLKRVFAGLIDPVSATDVAAEDVVTAATAPPLGEAAPGSQPPPVEVTGAPPAPAPAPAVVSRTASPPAAVATPAAPVTPPAPAATAPEPVSARLAPQRPPSPPASQRALAGQPSAPVETRPDPEAAAPAAPPVVPPAPAPAPAPATAANTSTPAATGREPATTDAPRDEALSLVRAYVAARNTAHAAGIRRVWPTVTDAALRRMTGEFSAPLTLTDCDVDAIGAGRARATCRFTQPAATAFSGGTALTLRRQLVFDIARQGRSWVIANVEG